MKVRIAIIGTAGRRDDKSKMSRAIYERMVHTAIRWITDNYNPEDVQLVSGGAAWADHVAVSLYLSRLDFAGLELHFPAPFINSQFRENGFRSPGSTANYYHHLFGLKMSGNRSRTLRGIQMALDKGATFTVGRGFHDRNLVVGDVDVVLAFTWGNGDVPKDGGTKHTWDNSRASTKVHFPLASI